jgi:hypothetical protein
VLLVHIHASTALAEQLLRQRRPSSSIDAAAVCVGRSLCIHTLSRTRTQVAKAHALSKRRVSSEPKGMELCAVLEQGYSERVLMEQGQDTGETHENHCDRWPCGRSLPLLLGVSVCG